MALSMTAFYSRRDLELLAGVGEVGGRERASVIHAEAFRVTNQDWEEAGWQRHLEQADSVFFL